MDDRIVQVRTAQFGVLNKGRVFKTNGRWHWQRNNGGVEPFPARTRLIEVRQFIARVAQAKVSDVSFVPIRQDLS